MEFITPEYLEQNKALHKTRKDFGASSAHWVTTVKELCERLDTIDVLDYGCGKGKLAANLPFHIHQYDPAIVKHSKEPKPADIVVCTDVMEHIEPECLISVLKHLKSLTKKACFFAIATRPAKKHLPDGRNAHLIIQNANWWTVILSEYFDIQMMQNKQGEVVLLCMCNEEKSYEEEQEPDKLGIIIKD